MITPEALSALRDRLAAATGPDREIDALLEVQARRFEAYAVGLNDTTRAQWRASPDGTVSDPDAIYYAPHFTSGIDAALGLVTRLLPGWRIALVQMAGHWQANIAEIDAETDLALDDYFDDGPTAPLAILTCLVSALYQPGVQS